jgi:hypothetical protein
MRWLFNIAWWINEGINWIQDELWKMRFRRKIRGKSVDEALGIALADVEEMPADQAVHQVHEMISDMRRARKEGK